MKHLLMIGACAALTINVGCGKQQAQQDEEWTLVWEETFDQGDSFDTTRWSKIPRGFVDWNRQMSDYDSLYAIRDGNMVLRGIVNDCLPDDPVPYLTGGIFTKGKVGFSRGRLEVRARLQGATGAWPAIWLMPQHPTEGWPACGEIDIMEHLSHDNIAYQTVHSSYTVDRGITDNPRSSSTGPINADDFNTYAVELYLDSVVFYINEVHVNTYPRLEPAESGQFPFDKEWYLMLDMQLGGKWVGEVDPADLPVEMLIDWVRFYQK